MQTPVGEYERLFLSVVNGGAARDAPDRSQYPASHIIEVPGRTMIAHVFGWRDYLSLFVAVNSSVGND